MSAAPAKETPLLERLGVRYIEGPAAAPDVAPDDAVHVLNARERQALRAIEHAAVARAAVCGALAAGVCTLPPILLHGLHARDPARSTSRRRWPRWRGSSGTGSARCGPSRGRPG